MSKVKRKVRKGKEQHEDANIKSSSAPAGQLLCCVPEDIGSVECAQQVISDPETAVKMTCSNLQCTNSGLLHLKCYERLEKHLLSALGSTPKGKKWTEAQLKANMWNCRGADILHKFSKCSCGGTLAKAEEESETPLPVVKKKEKGKVNQKPKLNSGEGGKISDQKMFKWGLEEPVCVKEPPSIRQPISAEALKPKAPLPKAPSTASKAHQLPLRSQLPLLKSDLPLLKADLPVKYNKGGSYPWTGKGPYQGLKTKEDISKILHVFNMPKNCRENHLGELFQAYGKVTDVWISAPPRNFAFVTFDSAKGVDKVLADIPIQIFGCHSLTVERKKPRASKVSVSSSTCSKDDCYCPANQLCTCATSIRIPPVKRTSPQRNPWSSSSTAGVVSATPSTKPPSAILACPQKQRQDSWKAFDPFDDPVISSPSPSSLGLTSDSSREIFEELLGKSFSRELEDPAEAEIFLSDDEGEEDVGDLEPPSASGSNEEVEQNRLQEEPDSMITHLEDLLQEKNALEREKGQLWAEKMKQEGELFQAKACNDLLKQKLEALEGQHRSEKELLEKVLEEAKACIKVLRERMESFQEQLKQKEIKEKKLEETLCEEKELRAKIEREREELEGEVCRLTEALTSSPTDDRGGVNSRRMLRVTQSAPGGLAGNTSPGKESSRLERLRPLWKCSICTFHNSASRTVCEMCSKPRPAIVKDPVTRMDAAGSTCTVCSLFNGPGTRFNPL